MVFMASASSTSGWASWRRLAWPWVSASAWPWAWPWAWPPLRFLGAGLGRARLQRAHDVAPETLHDAVARERDQLDRARLPRLEADRRARRDVQAEPARRRAIEAQPGVGLGEVVVRPDLDGSIAGVRHLELDGRAPLVQGQRARLGLDGADPQRRARRDRMVHGHQLGSVGERRLDLDLGDQLGHAFHDVVGGQQPRAGGHQVGDATAVARAFQDRGRDVRDRLGVVQLQAARLAPLGQQGCGEQQQLVFLTGCQFHDSVRAVVG